MARKKTVKVDDRPVPQSLEEVSRWIEDIATSQRVIDRTKTDAEDKIVEANKEAEAIIEPEQKFIKDAVDGIFSYCAAHKDELTVVKKTVELPSGVVLWRMTPPKLNVRNTEDVLAKLKILGLAAEFIRTKEEVDKEALKGKPEVVEAVEGLSLSQHEEFVVKPLEIEGAEYTKALKATKKS
jgi:phage host-nuclease inhibitor protein Gam